MLVSWEGINITGNVRNKLKNTYLSCSPYHFRAPSTSFGGLCEGGMLPYETKWRLASLDCLKVFEDSPHPRTRKSKSASCHPEGCASEAYVKMRLLRSSGSWARLEVLAGTATLEEQRKKPKIHHQETNKQMKANNSNNPACEVTEIRQKEEEN